MKTVMMPGLSKLEVASQTMEIRSLWESAIMLNRITEILVCLFFLTRSFVWLGSPQCFLFLSNVPQEQLTGLCGGGFLEGYSKRFFGWRFCTAPGDKHRGGHGKAADIKSTITCSFSILKNPGSVHCPARKQSRGWGQRKDFWFIEEITSLCPSPWQTL